MRIFAVMSLISFWRIEGKPSLGQLMHCIRSIGKLCPQTQWDNTEKRVEANHTKDKGQRFKKIALKTSIAHLH